MIRELLGVIGAQVHQILYPSHDVIVGEQRKRTAIIACRTCGKTWYKRPGA